MKQFFYNRTRWLPLALFLVGFEIQSFASNVGLVSNHVEIAPGLNMFANNVWQRGNGGNTVRSLLTNLPAGSILYKFNPTNQQFTANRFSARGWERPDELLQRGEGAILLNPTRRSFYVDFSGGNYVGGSVVLASGFTLVGNISEPWSFYDWSDDFLSYMPLEEGDIIFTLDQSRQILIPHVFHAEPPWSFQVYLQPTESFFVFTRHPRTVMFY
jgi:hypothetical protein